MKDVPTVGVQGQMVNYKRQKWAIQEKGEWLCIYICIICSKTFLSNNYKGDKPWDEMTYPHELYTHI